MKILLLVISFSLTLPTTAGEATEPVAIVEEASADAPVKTFSYLSQGQIINLGPKAELLIGFLRSCVQERVRGGVVKIGADRSHVTNGQRFAKPLDCGGAAKLSRAESERGAALVMRKPPVPAPKIRLTSTTPLIAPRTPGLLCASDTSRPQGDRHEIGAPKRGCRPCRHGRYPASWRNLSRQGRCGVNRRQDSAGCPSRRRNPSWCVCFHSKAMFSIRRDLPAPLIAAAVTALFLFSGPADWLRGPSLDALFFLRASLFYPPRSHEPPISIVALDEETYRRPPFRGTPKALWTPEIGQVLSAVLDGGASVVGFDLIMATSAETRICRGTTTSAPVGPKARQQGWPYRTRARPASDQANQPLSRPCHRLRAWTQHTLRQCFFRYRWCGPSRAILVPCGYTARRSFGTELPTRDRRTLPGSDA